MNIFTEEKYIKHLNRRVKTPFGYQTIEYVYKTKPLPVLIITLKNKQIEVCANHTFIVEGNEVPAYDLADGDYLETLTGMQKVLEIQSAGKYPPCHRGSEQPRPPVPPLQPLPPCR